MTVDYEHRNERYLEAPRTAARGSTVARMSTTITATRMRLDGQREHAVLDEYGMPTEWRVAIQPEFK
jgi:hypothetical protein